MPTFLLQSRFTDSEPLVGYHIPGSPEGVISAGATIDDMRGFLGSLRVRTSAPGR